MKKVLIYTVGCLIGIIIATLIISVIIFCLFWLAVGIGSFIIWSLPVTIPSIWFTIRLSISAGLVVSILYMFSREGQEAYKNFAEDLFNL
jgi:hypothetical protein